jgi:hypothetical protein
VLREHPDRIGTADIAAAGAVDRARIDEAERNERTDPLDGDLTDRAVRGAPTDEGPMAGTPLFSADEADGLRTRWEQIQTSFVDEPRRSVEQADTLVADVMKRLADGFSDERSELEHQWTEGSDVSTEDLRVALRRYRSFFDRLLSV